MTRRDRKEVRGASVVAQRTLRRRADGKPFHVVLYAPVREHLSPEEWACSVGVRIARQPERVLSTGRGVDSLQALVMALVGLRKALQEEADGLVWLGEPGEIGVPLVVAEHDPTFLNVIDALVQTEYAHRAAHLKYMRSYLARRAKK